VKLTTHLHLVPRSRMRGSIHPVPQYAFMVWCSVKAQRQLTTYGPECIFGSVSLSIHLRRKICLDKVLGIYKYMFFLTHYSLKTRSLCGKSLVRVQLYLLACAIKGVMQAPATTVPYSSGPLDLHTPREQTDVMSKRNSYF
jgi:hypothetical protein